MITGSDSPNKRCVNIDWLEVYCLESNDEYPCDPDYFRRHGYWVQERDYGTRQYNQMFVLQDNQGNPWIEIRRDPASGHSDFTGLVPQSTHIRLANRTCYYTDAVSQLRDFLFRHNYIFKRIFRIDICYDFEFFDSGDRPDKFARRYLERKYRKINQCKIHAIGDDTWSDFGWESLSWGAHGSMVSTKMYNKSKELETVSKHKTYIPYSWWQCGLIDHPSDRLKIGQDGKPYKPEIWRVEFSIKSSADSWVVIDSQSGKRVRKKAEKHTLSMFDSPDKLWQRFEELAFHYFHFKKFVEGQRKDRCPDKILFHFNQNREFCQLQQLPPASKPEREDRILLRHLAIYSERHTDPDIRKACKLILDAIRTDDLRRFTPHGLYAELDAIRLAIATRTDWTFEKVLEVATQIKSDIDNKLQF